ncbi:MAG TPA: hypothetical protein VFW04_01160, partial [Gemmatimonadaceae bacterium]|nr:hypothetical protein [Gemmatimonadaceae bacterium]
MLDNHRGYHARGRVLASTGLTETDLEAFSTLGRAPDDQAGTGRHDATRAEHDGSGASRDPAGRKVADTAT